MPFPTNWRLVMQSVVELAIGLGGWKVDPADPFKAPYSPDNAALAAADYLRLTLDKGELEAVARAVQRAYDADTRNPDDYVGGAA